MQTLASVETGMGVPLARVQPLGLRTGLVQSVAQQILELIDREGLKAGDRLPPTRTLAQRFQVATPTIREVLRRLQATGVVDIRHGSGIYVRQEHRRVVIVNPNLGELDSSLIVSLLDTRLLIEPPMAALAARIIDETGIATLQGILTEAEQYLDGNDHMLHRVNMSFHLGIARCTRNIALTHIMESLVELYSFEQFAILSLFNARCQDHSEHKEICAAIRDRDPMRAHAEMEKHIAHIKLVVERRLRERKKIAEEPIGNH